MTVVRINDAFRTFLAVLPLLCLLVGFFVLPLLWILWDSVEGGDLNFEHYARVFSESNNLRILLHTLYVGALVTLFSVIIGYPVAFLMTRLSPRALSIVAMFALVPLFTAFLIRTYAWMVILGRQGIINNTLIWLELTEEPLKILGTTTAVVIGMTHVFTPMAIFTIYSAMCRINSDFLRSAQVLGANPVQAFNRVYLPLSLPGVLSASILVFIVSIGFYITPALLGGPADTMISQLIVVQMTTLLNFELGYASSIVLLLITVSILIVANLLIPLEMIWSPADAVGQPRFAMGRSAIANRLKQAFLPLFTAVERVLFGAVGRLMSERQTWLWAFTIAVLFFLVAPLLVIVILSFSSSPFVVFPPPGFSLRWWEKLYLAGDWHAAFLFSFRLGVTVAIVATIIGTMGAFWLVRTTLPFKRALFLFSLAPLMLPVIIIATSLYVYQARLGLLGTFWGLVIGHTLLAMPFAIVVMTAALRDFDRTLEHAASVHGARPWQTLRRVTLPILNPALVTAALLAFLTSFDELLIGIFLLGRQTPTLPIKFWGDIKYQIDPLLSTASTLIVIVVTLTILLAHAFRLHHAKRTTSRQES